MRIALTGATGFLGSSLAERLLQGGHSLVLLVRRPEPARQRFLAAEVHRWDFGQGPPPAHALEGTDAVVHLMGESVAGGRWSAARKSRIWNSRVESTRMLMQSLRDSPAARPGVIIGASAVGYYGNRGDETLPEPAGPGAGFLAQLCVEWEAALRSGAPTGARTLSLRTGLVLGTGGGALPRLAALFRLGLGGRLGSGRQWMSWIHIDDWLSLVELVLGGDRLSGAVNAVSPAPVTNAEFTRALVRAVRRPALFPAPEFLLKLALGEMSSLLLYSQRAMPAVAADAGFPFRFPELGAALDALLNP